MLFFNLVDWSRIPGKIKRLSLPLLVCLTLISVLGSMNALAGQQVIIDGTPHIQNGSTPSQGIEEISLRELWRAGGEEDSEIIFGLICQIRGDQEGNVYVYDAQFSHVHHYAPDGELVQTLFGQGEGPGEMRRGSDLLLHPNGDLSLLASFGGKIVTVAPNGDPRPSHAIETENGFSNLYSGLHRQGNLILGCKESIQLDRDMASRHLSYIASFTDDGEEIARFAQKEREIDYLNNFTFRESEALEDLLFNFTVGPDGRVYSFTSQNEYAISVYNPDGSLDRIIEREFTPLPRSAKSKSRMEALVERRFRTFPFDLSIEIEDIEPTVNWLHRGLHVDDDGYLWVRHSRSGLDQKEGILLTYDLFDPSGHFVKQVAVACEGNALYDGLFFAGENRVIRVPGFTDAMRTHFGGGQGGFEGEAEPDAPEVICYQIQ